MKVSKRKMHVVHKNMSLWGKFGCTWRAYLLQLSIDWSSGTSNNRLIWCLNSILVSLYLFLFNPCKSVPVCRCVGLCAYKSCMASSLMKAKATWLIVVAMSWIRTTITIDRFFIEAWPRQIVLMKILTCPKYPYISITRKWKLRNATAICILPPVLDAVL